MLLAIPREGGLNARARTTRIPSQELGGAPPPELMGEDFSSPRPGLGLRRGGPDGGLSDDCKLYVGSLPMGFTESQVEG